MVDANPEDPARAGREKSLVAASSVVAAVFITGLKVVVALATGSLGILSEAAHSGLDLIAAAVTLWAVRVSARPADRDHPYGHGKIENFSALFETGLLLATCVWIVYESVIRLFYRDVHVEVTVWAFAVMAVSIVVDVSRSRALARVAKKYRSQALEADALHFSTDIWSSAVVIVGLIGVVAAERLQIPWLVHADAVSALGVAVIVVIVGLRLARKSVDDLLDAAPSEAVAAVAAAARVEGVVDVTQVRVRRSGPTVFADVTLRVVRDASFEDSHEIASRAESAVREAVHGADVFVHVEPSEDASAGLSGLVRDLATRQGLGAHDVRVVDARGVHGIELHVEVPEALTVREAHERVRALERDIRRALPRVQDVTTRMELATDGGEDRVAVPDGELPVRAALAEITAARGLGEPSEVDVYRTGGEIHVEARCRADGALSIGEARARAADAERSLRARFPELSRVELTLEPR